MFYSIFSVSSFYRIAPARLTHSQHKEIHTQRIHTFTVQYVLPNLKAKFKMARRGVNQFGWFASVRGPEKPLNTSFSKRECWSTARKWINQEKATNWNQSTRSNVAHVCLASWPSAKTIRPLNKHQQDRLRNQARTIIGRLSYSYASDCNHSWLGSTHPFYPRIQSNIQPCTHFNPLAYN